MHEGQGPMTRAKKSEARVGTGGGTAGSNPRCGLCGKMANLTKTECCGRWICDDEDKYVLFSYARYSCHRNQIGRAHV